VVDRNVTQWWIREGHGDRWSVEVGGLVAEWNWIVGICSVTFARLRVSSFFRIRG